MFGVSISPAIAAQVRVAQVVGKDEYDIWYTVVFVPIYLYFQALLTRSR